MKPQPTLPAAAVLAAVAVLAAPCPATAQTTAFTGATVWDGTGAPAVENATLLVRGGRIVRVGPGPAPRGARVVDLTGRWVIPGLVDAHAHVSGRWAPESVRGDAARMEADLRLFARYGVTTVNSLGGEPEAAESVRATGEGEAPGHARLRYAGQVVAAETPAEARAAVRVNAARHVDWIKLRVDDNLGTTRKMPWPAVEAVVAEAAAHDLPVATHLFYLEDAKRLLRIGSRLLAHSVRDVDVDDELIQLLRDSGVCYVPTLTRELSTFVYGGRAAFLDDPFFQRWADRAEVARVSDPGFQETMRESPAAAGYRDALLQASRNLARLSEAGVPIAFGTDAGPPARFPGYFQHLELGMMVEAGLSPEQALRSATGVAADCLGLGDVGTLTPGRRADFLVLGGDPRADIRATRSLEAVYVGGEPVR